MVNNDKIRQKILGIESNLSKLTILKNLDRSDFLADFRNVESAKHLLQVSIETMSDICEHIIARNRFGTPETAAECYRILAEKGLIEQKNADNYITMTKFRNKVVHLYFEIKDEEIYKILQENLGDFKVFISEILKITT